MKAHVGVDVSSRLVHTAGVTSGNVHDAKVMGSAIARCASRHRQERGPGVLAVGARTPVSRPQDTCVRLTTPGHPLPPVAVAGGFDKENVRLSRERSHRRVDQSFPRRSHQSINPESAKDFLRYLFQGSHRSSICVETRVRSQKLRNSGCC
jgi:hypothetical protein